MPFWESLRHNLRLLFRALSFRRSELSGLIASPGQVLFAIAGAIAVELAAALHLAWPPAGIDPFGLIALAALWFGLLGSFSLGVVLVGRASLVPAALMAFSYAIGLAGIVSALTAPLLIALYGLGPAIA